MPQVCRKGLWLIGVIFMTGCAGTRTTVELKYNNNHSDSEFQVAVRADSLL